MCIEKLLLLPHRNEKKHYSSGGSACLWAMEKAGQLLEANKSNEECVRNDFEFFFEVLIQGLHARFGGNKKH